MEKTAGDAPDNVRCLGRGEGGEKAGTRMLPEGRRDLSEERKESQFCDWTR